MNVQELVNTIQSLENKEDTNAQYEAMEKLGYFDERDDVLYNRKTGEPYNNSFIPRNVYNQEEIELINDWAKSLGEDNFEYTPFAERTFLRNFLESITPEEQIKYISNTNMYYGNNKQHADNNYVLITRRTLPSIEDKHEAFWSEDVTTTFWGLRNEIRNEQRTYSAIIVSTLGLIQQHGNQDFETLSGGASDGEIITSSQPFPRDKILFAFKPQDEVSSLIETCRKSTKTYDEFLSVVKSIMNNKYRQINPSPQQENKTPDTTFDDWEMIDDWD